MGEEGASIDEEGVRLVGEVLPDFGIDSKADLGSGHVEISLKCDRGESTAEESLCIATIFRGLTPKIEQILTRFMRIDAGHLGWAVLVGRVLLEKQHRTAQ